MTASTFPGATPRPIEIWRVEVYANGDKILNIEHGCLSGKERFSEAEEELVRECGRHLLGFVGAPEREDDKRFAKEISQLHRHHLILRCRNGRSWITAFHHSLDGIEGLFSIPGGGIDGCRDHSNVRAIVMHIIKERDALKDDVQRVSDLNVQFVEFINAMTEMLTGKKGNEFKLSTAIKETKSEVQRLRSIKRLLLYVLNGLLDVETDDWVKAQAATAISNAKLIDNGTYRPGVFMPTGSEEVAE